MPRYLVETYLPRGRFGERTARQLIGIGAGGGEIRKGREMEQRKFRRWIAPIETCFHLYEASSADAVREAVRRADLPIDRASEKLTATKGART